MSEHYSLFPFRPNEEHTVTCDTVLERTTELFVGDDGRLRMSTSSTPGVTVERIYIDGERLLPRDVPEELREAIMDALYDEGYTS